MPANMLPISKLIFLWEYLSIGAKTTQAVYNWKLFHHIMSCVCASVTNNSSSYSLNLPKTVFSTERRKEILKGLVLKVVGFFFSKDARPPPSYAPADSSNHPLVEATRSNPRSLIQPSPNLRPSTIRNIHKLTGVN